MSDVFQGREYGPGWSCMADRDGGGGRGGESADGRQDGGGGDGGGGGGGNGGSDGFARCQEWGLMAGTLRLRRRDRERENQGRKIVTMSRCVTERWID